MIESIFDKDIEYKDYFIHPFTITSLKIGDRTYDGWTTYSVSKKVNGEHIWFADYFEANGDPHIRRFATLKGAKIFITNKIKGEKLWKKKMYA